MERLGIVSWVDLRELVLHPAVVALFALIVFRLDPMASAVLIAGASLPVAGNVFILAQHLQCRAITGVGHDPCLNPHQHGYHTAGRCMGQRVLTLCPQTKRGHDMETISENKCFGGVQGVYRHPSKATGCDMTFGLFLPAEAALHPVPLLWYLSGLTCTHENAMSKAGLQAHAAAHGLAVVFPDTSPRGEGVADDPAYDLGQGAGFYVNATQTPWAPHFQMWDYITDELPRVLFANFALEEDRQAITGHSMGGHGALTMAMQLPGRFASVSAYAPHRNPNGPAHWPAH